MRKNTLKFSVIKIYMAAVIFFPIIAHGFQYLKLQECVENGLPFDRGSDNYIDGRKVFAHYFPSFPISIDNKESSVDYYQKNYLSPDGEGKKFYYSGGFIKQRPIPRAVINSYNWAELDIKKEIGMAAAVGIDGFSVDILVSSGPLWDRVNKIFSVASSYDNFKIIIMPDMSAEFKSSPEKLYEVVLKLSKYPSAYRLSDGRLVLSPYNANKYPREWWVNFFALLKKGGVDVAFVPLVQGWKNYIEDFGGISYGMSDWGARSPSINKKTISDAEDAHYYDVKWMATVSPQDNRPKSLMYWEAGNSENYRVMWESAINGGADWVHIVSWNDYSEATEISPSTGTRFGFYDLTAFYVYIYKTGRIPKITKDIVFYFHRANSILYHPKKSLQSKLYSTFKDSDYPSDAIELLVFLRSPAELNFSIGGHNFFKFLDGGVWSVKFPLKDGLLEYSLVRNGKKIINGKSDILINSETEFQNFLYYSGSSARKNLFDIDECVGD